MRRLLATWMTLAWRPNPWHWLGLGLLLIYIRGLFLDVMDVDASQYASIAMEMMQDGNWLQVQHRHADYLDKPPLLFWSSALSFALFGLHNWAYKLPSFLGAIAGVYAVYRFCLLFYSRETATLAAFILASSTGVLLLCNDVRTDTLLMGMTACAVWWLAASAPTPPPASRLKYGTGSPPKGRGASPQENSNSGIGETLSSLKKESNFPVQKIPRGQAPLPMGGGVGGGVCLALAMLAKGPIGLVVPAFAVGAHLLLQRNWRGIFQWRWLLMLLVTGLVLLPMCWGLYQQFDLHPEKVVHQRSGVSGLYFYFWEQSFGRITGENVWKNDTSPFYFLHVYLWAFLPWSLLLIVALWSRIRDLFRNKFRLPEGDEAYSIGAFVLAFVALSMSRYKLPHYIFVTLPWAAVLVARWLAAPPPTPPPQGRGASPQENYKLGSGQASLSMKGDISTTPEQKISRGQAPLPWRGGVGGGAVHTILFLASILLLAFVFPTANPLKWAITLGLFTLLAVSYWKKILSPGPAGTVQRGVLAMLAVGFVLNFHFYPNLLPYQSTAAVPRYAHQHGIPAEKLAFFNRHGHALDFYAGRILEGFDSPGLVRQKAVDSGNFWLYTNEDGRAQLDSVGVLYEQTASFPHFQVALLQPAFLNPATRATSLKPVYLLKILEKQ